MNGWNHTSRLLCAATCGTALLVAQRSAQAQEPAAPNSAEPVPAAGPAAPVDAYTPAPGEQPAVAAPVTPAAEPPKDVAPPPVSEPKAKSDKLRFEIGGRLGYGIPFGSVESGSKLKDVFAATVPGVLDGWLRFPGGFALGLYLGLAAGISGKALDSCPDCSALNYRLGIQAARHFNDGGTVDPWVGIGLGFEWASITQQSRYQGLDLTYDDTYSALPELTAQAGLDIGGDTVAFGPYVSLSYAAYSKMKSTLSCSNIGCNDGVSTSNDVDGGGHGWLSLGLRGTYLR